MSSAKQTLPSEIVTVAELSKILKVSPGTIYYWVSRKEIPYRKVGRHLRFNLGSVLAHFKLCDKDDDQDDF